MNYVLITISGGIIDEVCFYAGISEAIWSLSEYVKTMDSEKNDAGVYSPYGMVANTKDFLNDSDHFVDNYKEVMRKYNEHRD